MSSPKKETFGDTEVLIIPIKEDHEYSHQERGGLTYTSDTPKVATKLQSVIRSIGEDVSGELGKIQEKLRPSTVEMEISLGFSAKSNMWVIGVEGEQKVTLKFAWNCDERRRSDAR